jgi:hypothetical protein
MKYQHKPQVVIYSNYSEGRYFRHLALLELSRLFVAREEEGNEQGETEAEVMFNYTLT